MPFTDLEGNVIRDKNGVEIEEFDILKVFHFIGARRKRHYMYKMAVVREGRLYGSHLYSNENKPDYPLWTLFDSEQYEIIQSKNWEKL